MYLSVLGFYTNPSHHSKSLTDLNISTDSSLEIIEKVQWRQKSQLLYIDLNIEISKMVLVPWKTTIQPFFLIMLVNVSHTDILIQIIQIIQIK